MTVVDQLRQEEESKAWVSVIDRNSLTEGGDAQFLAKTTGLMPEQAQTMLRRHTITGEEK